MRGTAARRMGIAIVAVLAGVIPAVGVAPGAAGAADATVVGTVVSGFHHTCVVMANQTVQCWGGNNTNQVGSGATSEIDQFTPVPVTATSVVSVASGDNHTCVLKTAGTVDCWGSDFFGQLGRGVGAVDSQTPVAVSGLTGITEITAGSFFSCALQSTGKVFCWGDNHKGQAGVLPAPGDPTVFEATNPAVLYPIRPTPVEVTGITNAIAIEAGTYHACALLADGTVSCWGNNGWGQLGTGVEGPDASLPAVVAGLGQVKSIAAGFAHTCALKTSGNVFCWGLNNYGQLGTVAPHYTPDIIPGLNGVAFLAAGYEYTCAVVTTETTTTAVKCWGRNDTGQLGNGSVDPATSPPTPHPTVETVIGVTTAIAVAPGSGHTCAVLASGTVSCWGSDARGAIGDGAGVSTSASAVPVPGLTNVAVVAQPTPVTPGVPPPAPAPAVTENPYTPLAAPVRLLDTRSPGGATIDNAPAFTAIGARTPTAPAQDLQLRVTGRTGAGIISTATAVMLNVTVVGAQGDQGYLTVYPCGQARPEASNLNFGAGDTIANSVLAKVGTGGAVCIYTSVATDLLVDASGYYADTSTFVPLANPARILETRTNAAPTVDANPAFSNIGRRSPAQRTVVKVTRRANVPETAPVVVLNVTAIGADAPGGFVTVYSSCADAPPNSSNLNYATGETIAGFVIARTDVNGDVCIFNEVGVDLAVDVLGYFTTATAYTPLPAPTRYLDTRVGGATFDNADRPGTPVTPDLPYCVTIAGRGQVSLTAAAVQLNVTVVAPDTGGFVTVYPKGVTRPNASNVNYEPGQIIANSVSAAIGQDKQVCVYTSQPAHIIVDVAGTLS